MKIEVEASALESIKAMCERLQEERDELLSALQYWLPLNEPLQYQNDVHSMHHRNKWYESRAIIAKCTAEPKVLE